MEIREMNALFLNALEAEEKLSQNQFLSQIALTLPVQ